MSTRKRVSGVVAAAECAELYRDVFWHLAHELSGISSALGLRADALATQISAADQEALRGLSTQLRDINRLLRQLQGPGASGPLAPARSSSAAEWWAVAQRLFGTVLPRGVNVAATIGDAEVTPEQSTYLVHLLMLAARDRVDAGLAAPSSIRLSIHSALNDAHRVEIVAELDHIAGALESTAESAAVSRKRARWQRYATRLARQTGADMQWWATDVRGLRWQCLM